MTGRVVIGVGNAYRRDDGVGPAVAEEIARLAIPGVRVVTANGDPAALLEAWKDAELAIVVDAAAGKSATPGRIRRWTPGQSPKAGVVSSHAIGVPDAYALGEAIGQQPKRLVVLSVDVTDTDHGPGLTPEVAVAVSAVVGDILAELGT
jgi:hydrogenase maturation protease